MSVNREQFLQISATSFKLPPFLNERSDGHVMCLCTSQTLERIERILVEQTWQT